MQIIEEKINKKKRHGFTHFWLYFLLIANVLSIIIFPMLFFIKKYTYDYILVIMYVIFFSAVVVVYTILIIQWKKIGFSIFICDRIVRTLIDISIFPDNSVIIIIANIIGIFIFYKILNLRKYGMSTWEQLK
jgi:hypothetical protein